MTIVCAWFWRGVTQRMKSPLHTTHHTTIHHAVHAQMAVAREKLTGAANIRVLEIPQDDSWFRDTGPTVRFFACVRLSASMHMWHARGNEVKECTVGDVPGSIQRLRARPKHEFPGIDACCLMHSSW